MVISTQLCCVVVLWHKQRANLHCCTNKTQKFALVNFKMSTPKKQVEQVCHFYILKFVFNHGHNYRGGKQSSVVVLVICNLMCTMFRPGKK